MPVCLTFVSHGLTAAMRAVRFPCDEPLDRAAAEGAARVDPPVATRVLIAPELRCRQTAAAMGLAGVESAQLRDLDTGGWRGKALAGLPADQAQAWLTDPDFDGHGGESITQMCDRVADWLAAVAADGIDTVAVTHPAVIRAAVLHTLSAPAHALWRVDVAPLSQTVLHHRGAWTLRSLGCS